MTVATATAATSTSMDPDERLRLLVRLLHDDALELTDRVAGCQLVAYAQPLSRITAITLDHIVVRDEATTICLGGDAIVVPEPLASLIGALIDTPRAYIGIRATADNPWLFAGLQPGRPLTAARLGARLGKLWS